MVLDVRIFRRRLSGIQPKVFSTSMPIIPTGSSEEHEVNEITLVFCSGKSCRHHLCPHCQSVRAWSHFGRRLKEIQQTRCKEYLRRSSLASLRGIQVFNLVQREMCPLVLSFTYELMFGTAIWSTKTPQAPFSRFEENTSWSKPSSTASF